MVGRRTGGDATWSSPMKQVNQKKVEEVRHVTRLTLPRDRIKERKKEIT